MTLAKKYQPQISEPRWMEYWKRMGTYRFSEESDAPVYSIDTPPPTVSGKLHLGHAYSYTHPDIFARFWRMRGYNVFYPMGFDDNGLPTERLVEKHLGITVQQVGRGKFIQTCLQVSAEAEKEYKTLWRRLGLSIDWRHTYRTIDPTSQRISQLSFIRLHKKDLVYRQKSPAIWCPECQTSIAQAEINDLERESEFITISFVLEDGGTIPIATTRPELLPACVAVFVHPQDGRYAKHLGKGAYVPIFGQQVPILSDEAADPQKGTGAVMCCTFGDSIDIAWWYQYKLPLIEIINPDGLMSPVASPFDRMPAQQARQDIIHALHDQGLIHDRHPITQSVRVHERCDTPVEYLVKQQWFIRLLDLKEELLNLGEKLTWYPQHMRNRYLSWVENLKWDWCISRQRYFGVPIPVWYCQNCGEVMLASENQLPVNPLSEQPSQNCTCGSTDFIPDSDIFDTWATSSMSPQIVAQWPDGNLEDENSHLYGRVFPFSLRPQAHEIIRTWAFYTLVKSHYHFGEIPWQNVLISGWGIAGEGMGKISKSRGGGSMSPVDMIQRYSADAVRFWATSTSPGKDSVISEKKIQLGYRFITKLWNVARFSEHFLKDMAQQYNSRQAQLSLPFTPADRWILARLQLLINQVTELLENYEYAAAKSEIEVCLWNDVTNNYLEMSKQRLYAQPSSSRDAAQYTLFQIVRTIVHLIAPFLPFIAEEIYQGLLQNDSLNMGDTASASVHTSLWPIPDTQFADEDALKIGFILVQVATAVRRYKSEHSLALSTQLDRLLLTVDTNSSELVWNTDLLSILAEADADLKSVTRAQNIDLTHGFDPSLFKTQIGDTVWLSIQE